MGTISHSEHAARANVATPCTAHHVNYGGGCLNCGWIPPPVPAAPNWQERARRADLIAAELDSVLSLILAAYVGSSDYTPEEKAAYLWRAQLARDTWTAHRADLDTLTQP